MTICDKTCFCEYECGLDIIPLPKETYEEKLAKAKEFLGENWVLHPNYKSNKKHYMHNFKLNKQYITPRTLKDAGII